MIGGLLETAQPVIFLKQNNEIENGEKMYNMGEEIKVANAHAELLNFFNQCDSDSEDDCSNCDCAKQDNLNSSQVTSHHH